MYVDPDGNHLANAILVIVLSLPYASCPVFHAIENNDALLLIAKYTHSRRCYAFNCNRALYE